MPKLTPAARLARDTDFRDRALVAALREALLVLGEDPETPNHTFRVSYAQSILRGPEQYQLTVSWLLASYPPFAEYQAADDVPDDEISAALHQVWNALSQP